MDSVQLPKPDGGEPKSCPLGHELKPGDFLRGWRPCGCENALANHGGHHWVSCEQPHEGFGTVTSLRPPCPDKFLAKA